MSAPADFRPYLEATDRVIAAYLRDGAPVPVSTLRIGPGGRTAAAGLGPLAIVAERRRAAGEPLPSDDPSALVAALTDAEAVYAAGWSASVGLAAERLDRAEESRARLLSRLQENTEAINSATRIDVLADFDAVTRDLPVGAPHAEQADGHPAEKPMDKPISGAVSTPRPGAESPAGDSGPTLRLRTLPEAAEGTAAGEPPAYVAAEGEPGALIYAGRVHALIGEPEAGKTWIAAAAVRDALASDPDARALWIDTDGMGGPGVLERLTAVGAPPADTGRVVYLGAEEMDEDPRAWLAAAAASGPWAAVVVDAWDPTMQRLGLDPYSPGDVTEFARVALHPFGGEGVGAAVLATDHVVKNPDNRRGYAAGSARKRAEVEVSIEVESHENVSRTTPGRATLRVRKDRPARLPRGGGQRAGTLHLEPDGSGGVAVRVVFGAEAGATSAAASAEWVPTGIMRKLSDALSGMTYAPGKTEMRRLAGSKAGYTDLAIAALEARGHLRVDRSGSTHLHHLERPYTAEDAAQDEAAQGESVSRPVPASVPDTLSPCPPCPKPVPSVSRDPAAPCPPCPSPYRGDTGHAAGTDPDAPPPDPGIPPDVDAWQEGYR